MSEALALEQYIDSHQFKFFKGRELTPYWSREKRGAANSVPPRGLWKNIVATLHVLDAIRERLGCPITITSSYRNQAYNAACGGEPNSYHKKFMAIDFQAKQGTPEQWAAVAKKLRAAGKFKGGIGVYPTFVHIDTRGSNADW